MLVPFVAIALLVCAVAAIYLLLKNMGQDGVEIAAPGSCKSGTCGVQRCSSAETTCDSEGDQIAETDEATGMATPDRQHALAEQESSRPG